jgi:hypothetical protein
MTNCEQSVLNRSPTETLNDVSFGSVEQSGASW